MDALIAVSWRPLPAGAVLAAGGFLVFLGMRRLLRFVWAGRGDAAFGRYASGLRLMFAGLALAGVAAAWITLQGWLLAIALGVGGEELLESSLILCARDTGRHPARRVHVRRSRHSSPVVRDDRSELAG